MTRSLKVKLEKMVSGIPFKTREIEMLAWYKTIGKYLK